ncbi:MAG TPA: glycosyltransferase [Candidatus Paceibacterota bacterium]|nr:glycosyltransferase [Candidatus Paceibacterota bacterium]
MVIKQTKQKFLRIKDDVGGFFLFFVLLYLISVVKLSSSYEVSHSVFFTLYSVLIGMYILSRFIFAYFHKSIPYDDSYEPTVTFVVPAKNEEDNIAETIRRFSQASYPKEKMEVIAINDGSTDNTLGEMLKVQKETEALGMRVQVIDWKVNRGKRDGMAEGVKRARHEIIIFIDSDSFIHSDCVRHLVKYFAYPKVGAVSGHTDVHNRDTNMLTRMQSLRYYVAFRVYKSAESIFGNVTCCPGCCSAYRKAYLDPIIDQWLNQKFMGVKCTFGDDRSLTNFIIRQYDAVYSPEAMAYTVVPDTFRKYVRQQQRWKKSWIRETFIACSFMWRRNTLAAISFYAYMFLAVAAPVVFIRASIYHPFFVTHRWPIAYFSGLGLMLLLHGVYYRNQVKKTAWFLPVITFWFYTIMLMWQLPWAFVTMRDTRWGTR